MRQRREDKEKKEREARERAGHRHENHMQGLNDSELVGIHNEAFFPDSLRTFDKLNTFKEQFASHHEIPTIMIAGDIDSVCTFSNSFEQLVDALGEKNLWSVPSVTRQWSADKGSRFCVNADFCETPPFIRGGEAGVVPLCWFPNVKVASCNVPQFGIMHVQLYYLGVESYTSNSYFTHVMMGVVNAMFNFARIRSRNHEDLHPSSRRGCDRFYNLRTRVGSKAWSRSIKDHSNDLNYNAMKVMANQAIEVLDDIAIDLAELKFEEAHWNGIQPAGKRRVTLDRQKMVAFAKKLRNNIAFTASLAGCKGSFLDEKYSKVIEIDCAKYDDMILNHDDLQNIVALLNSKESEEESKEESEEESKEESEEESEEESKEESKEESGQRYHSTDNPPPICHFDDIHEELINDINQKITVAKNDLNKVLMQTFRKAFKTEGDDVSRIYVDVAHEVWLDGAVNVFPRIAESKTILKAQLRER